MACVPDHLLKSSHTLTETKLGSTRLSIPSTTRAPFTGTTGVACSELAPSVFFFGRPFGFPFGLRCMCGAGVFLNAWEQESHVILARQRRSVFMS